MYWQFINLICRFLFFTKWLLEMKYANVLISFFVVLVVSGVIAYVYISPKVSEGSNILESRVNDLESRVSEQLLIIEISYYGSEPESISFVIMHMGTANVTISEIRVNDVLNSSSPGWVGNGTLIPGQMGEITLYGLKYLADGFTEGESYQFRFITARGNSFYCVVCYKGLTFTFMATEQLEIQGCTFNTGNANVTLLVQNIGTADLTVTKYKIGTSGQATALSSAVDVAQGASTTVVVPLTWSSGTTYDIYLITATGKQFPYRATAP